MATIVKEWRTLQSVQKESVKEKYWQRTKECTQDGLRRDSCGKERRKTTSEGPGVSTRGENVEAFWHMKFYPLLGQRIEKATIGGPLNSASWLVSPSLAMGASGEEL
jgi:hypothetical protein